MPKTDQIEAAVATPAGPEPGGGLRLELDALLRVCANLTAPKPLEEILDELLREARSIVRADAGSLYLRDAGALRFVCSQTDCGSKKQITTGLHDERLSGRLPNYAGCVSDESLAGHVGRSGQSLNIVDVYQLPDDAPYRFDPSYDQRSGFRTVSMLVTPMKDRDGSVIGVLQLINRRADSGEINPFGSRDEQTLASLAAVAAVSVRNAQLHEQLHRSHLDAILRLSTAAEFRDGDTGEHIRRMSCYSEAVARNAGRSPEWARQILFASPMHDVGKLAIPDAILKKPGPLSDEERRVMQRHTLIGGQILHGSTNEILAMAERIALSHHEQWDGSGYPHRLRGEAIPLEGRIVALADVFDALTNRRAYKPPFSLEEAFARIEAGRGRHFDPDLVTAFFAARDEIASIHEAYREV